MGHHRTWPGREIGSAPTLSGSRQSSVAARWFAGPHIPEHLHGDNNPFKLINEEMVPWSILHHGPFRCCFFFCVGQTTRACHIVWDIAVLTPFCPAPTNSTSEETSLDPVEKGSIRRPRLTTSKTIRSHPPLPLLLFKPHGLRMELKTALCLLLAAPLALAHPHGGPEPLHNARPRPRGLNHCGARFEETNLSKRTADRHMAEVANLKRERGLEHLCVCVPADDLHTLSLRDMNPTRDGHVFLTGVCRSRADGFPGRLFTGDSSATSPASEAATRQS